MFTGQLSAVHAQQAITDSLEGQLQQPGLPDSQRLALFTDLACYYASTHPATGLQYAGEAIRLASQRYYFRQLATAFNYKALNYQRMGRDSLARNRCWQEIPTKPEGVPVSAGHYSFRLPGCRDRAAVLSTVIPWFQPPRIAGCFNCWQIVEETGKLFILHPCTVAFYSNLSIL